MSSLRRTTLVWITVLLTAVGLIAVAVSYLVADVEARGFLDNQLRQIALNAGDRPEVADAPAMQHDPEDDFVVEIWNNEGQKVRTSHPHLDIPRQQRNGFADIDAAGDQWRSYSLSDSRGTVQVAQRLSVRREIAENAALGAATPLLAMMPLSWLMVGLALGRMLQRLTDLARDLAGRGTDARDPIPLADVPQEVKPLVAAMNSLITGLHLALDQQRRFLSDAAHELRTPLAALRLQIENLPKFVRDDAARPYLAELDTGARRASGLVEQLLRMARYDAAIPAGEPREIDLAKLVTGCIADHIPIADRNMVDLGVIEIDNAFVLGVASELRVLFGNLIDNAVRYTMPGGTIDVSVRATHAGAIVEIADSGRGIPPHLLPHVFDRFFRAAPPEVEGSGLGLAIAKAISDRHGFQISLQNRDNGSGVIARVICSRRTSM